MELTAQQVLDMTLVVTTLINENRPMPLKGKYRLGRWHAKLKPEFDVISQRRDAMILAYDTPVMIEQVDPETGEKSMVAAPGRYIVPDDKMAEFNAAWAEIAGEKISFDIERIPFAQLDLGDDANGSISAFELLTLGELISE